MAKQLRFFPLLFSSAVLVACTTTGPQPVSSPAPTANAKPVVVALAADAHRAQQQGRHEQAAQYLERALRIEPNDPELWHRLAHVRYAQSRYQQAVHLAAKSNALAGDKHDLRRRNWQMIADAWAALGQPEKAAAARRKTQP